MMFKVTGQPLVELNAKLDEVSRYLSETFGSTHLFIRPSASQVDAQFKAPANDLFLQAKLYSYIFQSSVDVRILQTILFTTSVAVRRAIQLSHACNSAGDLLGFLWQVRSILERFGNIYYLKTELDKVTAHVNLTSGSFTETYDYGPIIRNTLYGTLIRWNELSEKDLSSIDIEEFVGKKTKPLLDDHAAKQVLDKIDRLDKRTKGIRAAYEILCEYLHPNIGDYHAITTKWSENFERYGLKLIRRELSLEGISDGPTIDRVVLNKVYRCCSDCCNSFLGDMKSLGLFADELESKMQLYVRSIIRDNRKSFRRSDTCPCCSGIAIAKCCGKNLNLDV